MWSEHLKSRDDVQDLKAEEGIVAECDPLTRLCYRKDPFSLIRHPCARSDFIRVKKS